MSLCSFVISRESTAPAYLMVVWHLVYFFSSILWHQITSREKLRSTEDNLRVRKCIASEQVQMYIRVQVPEPQHKMSILQLKGLPQQTLNFGIPKVIQEASLLFGTVDFVLQTTFWGMQGSTREYLQIPTLFPPISIRTYPCLSLTQVSCLLVLFLPSTHSSPGA